MLEVLVKRHYRDHELHALSTATEEGRPFAVADYTLEGRRTHLVSTIGLVSELVDRAARWCATSPGRWPRGRSATSPSSTCTCPGRSSRNRPSRPRRSSPPCSRSSTSPSRSAGSRSPCAPGGGRPVRYFTFRPAEGAMVEDTLVRGMHPMVGRRLNLWRLRDFDVTRLEAPEDVLLYHCVAKGNEADQRLVALAQVRQLAVVRDETARSPRCPTSSARSPTASRRSAVPGAPTGCRPAARHEPHLGRDLAGHRGRGRPAHRPPGQHRAADGGRRHRGGARARRGWPARTGRPPRSRPGSPTSPGPGS